uniref:hypothetical protein n=1 Tax=Salmonella sp. SAL4448 TaxID=3159903 RepID=UPI00397E4E5E
VYDESNQPLVLAGSFGLAPGWQTGPLTLTGQKIVTACLAARTNGSGKTVRLSIRGPAVAAAPTATEAAQFDWREGAFWG